ncbi:MAG: copper amine oxidase [Actinomycetota bacterium]
MSKTWLLRLMAGLMTFALIGAACSSDVTGTATDTETEAPPEEETTPEEEAPAVDTQAATLTRDLTALLADHEYLAGLAVLQGVTAGPDSAEFEAAAGALDKNSVQLSDAIGSVYGDAGGKQFLSLWRAHIGFFVDYTLAKAGGDMAGQKAARNKLDGYRSDFGAFIEGATEGGLPADAVADALRPHVESTISAIDSVIVGDGKAFDKLREAAGHLPGIATALSGAISEQQGFTGTADDGASQLQRDLTALLADHEYLAGLAVLQGVTAGTDSAEFMAAAGALDKNSVQLSDAIGSVYGDAGGKKFLSLWRAHIGFFVDYTLAKAGGDMAGQKAARNKLDGYRSDFGAFIEGATEGGLPADAVADALRPHVESTISAIDSVIAGDGKAFDKLREAAGHLPGIATALSGAIVAQFPDMF